MQSLTAPELIIPRWCVFLELILPPPFFLFLIYTGIFIPWPYPFNLLARKTQGKSVLGITSSSDNSYRSSETRMIII